MRFQDVQPDEVVMYAEGMFSASVCAPARMTPEQVVERVNRTHPSGTEAGWQVSDDKTFRTGQPMPAPCDKEPETRRHWLLEA